MNVFVVTPYFQTPLAWVQQAHDSVKGQTVPAHHILVCDGGPPAQIQDFRGTHIVLQRNYQDYGNTPRLIGCYQAVTRDADAIAFLDADNWYAPDHLQGLLAFTKTNNLDVCSSSRTLHRLDGSFMMKCPVVNGRPYIDTSCLLVLKPAFTHLISWILMPQDVAAVQDQLVWKHLGQMGMRLGFLDRPTMAYRTRHQEHYALAGEAPPPGAVKRSDVHGGRYQ